LPSGPGRVERSCDTGYMRMILYRDSPYTFLSFPFPPGAQRRLCYIGIASPSSKTGILATDGCRKLRLIVRKRTG
ncbi:MAG: hypothetical protein OXF20_05740, partial [Gammaproteobacteria bacterium]|nr:hypothetical protein [Gammaproteobacteria bacterium]